MPICWRYSSIYVHGWLAREYIDKIFWREVLSGWFLAFDQYLMHTRYQDCSTNSSDEDVCHTKNTGKHLFTCTGIYSFTTNKCITIHWSIFDAQLILKLLQKQWWRCVCSSNFSHKKTLENTLLLADILLVIKQQMFQTHVSQIHTRIRIHTRVLTQKQKHMALNMLCRI